LIYWSMSLRGLLPKGTSAYDPDAPGEPDRFCSEADVLCHLLNVCEVAGRASEAGGSAGIAFDAKVRAEWQKELAQAAHGPSTFCLSQAMQHEVTEQACSRASSDAALAVSRKRTAPESSDAEAPSKAPRVFPKAAPQQQGQWRPTTGPKPCHSLWPGAGPCQYGDQCRFSHDPRHRPSGKGGAGSWQGSSSQGNWGAPHQEWAQDWAEPPPPPPGKGKGGKRW